MSEPGRRLLLAAGAASLLARPTTAQDGYPDRPIRFVWWPAARAGSRGRQAPAAVARGADSAGGRGLSFLDQHLVRRLCAGQGPAPIVARLNAAFNKSLEQPDIVKRAGELAIDLIDDSTPQSAKKFYDDQMAFWAPIVKASGAKPE